MIGTTLRQRYKITQRLGAGGFGETYLAEDLGIPITPKPKRVVKHLKPQQQHPAIKRLFEQEGAILYKLGQHDQIPQLFEYFEDNGQFFLIQEYIEGQDLESEIQPGQPWTEAQVIEFLQEMLEILSFVHRHNIIHRDIKPANIMHRKQDNKLVLIDFGIVKELSTTRINSRGQTMASISIGTPGYMASEQGIGKPRLSSDVYALGKTAIELLTGVFPDLLSEDEQGEIIWRNRVNVSDKLADFLTKMVRYHFKDRYVNATQALQEFLLIVTPKSKLQTPKTQRQSTSKSSAVPVAKPHQKKQPIQSQPQPQKNTQPKQPKIPLTALPANLKLPTYSFESIAVNSRGEVVEKRTHQAFYFREDLVVKNRQFFLFSKEDTVSLDMVYIPGGIFMMGAPTEEKNSRDSERPQHQVTVQPFFMGKYAITQAQWRAVAALPKLQQDLKPDPSRFKGDNRPVENVNWYETVEFCARLSVATGRQYCLPSEAQWEYACRAGTTTPFSFGETVTAEIANYDGNKTYADEPKGKYRKQTTPVGSFPPNGFGLYDMHGNVWEWCADPRHNSYEGAPPNGRVWDDEHNNNRYQNYPDSLSTLLNNKSNRIIRGGSWFYIPWYCRSAYRVSNVNPDVRYDYIGFRVVCVSSASPSKPKSSAVSIAKPPQKISPIQPQPQPQKNTQPKQPKQSKIPSTASPSKPKLPTYSFEVITVNSKGEVIQNRSHQASYFQENLVVKNRQFFLFSKEETFSLDMVYVPGGTFVMGAPIGEKDSRNSERPQHQVTVQPFFMGKYAITQAQWRAVAALPKLQRDLNPNPSQFKGDDSPVERVNWYDAVEFCARLSVATGKQYCLPSEAQWEYACRANTTTPFHFGETITTEIANYKGSETYADETKGEFRLRTISVGSFPPNSFGLYDIAGNVWEWCADPWHDNYEKAPTDGKVYDAKCNDNRYQNYVEYLSDILNNRSNHVIRGGSWFFNPRNCRSALRVNFNPFNTYNDLGFRVVCASPRKP